MAGLPVVPASRDRRTRREAEEVGRARAVPRALQRQRHPPSARMSVPTGARTSDDPSPLWTPTVMRAPS
jgi:hypothetical protein